MGLRTWLKGQVKQLQGKPQARFEAARSGRLSSDFLRPHTSANAEIRMDLQTLRNSARALSRDNPHVREIKRTYRTNVIGARGIQLRPQIKQLSGDALDERRNAMVMEQFNLWCRSDSFDVAGKHSFLSAQWAIPGALIDTGEVFFRIVRGNKFGRSRVPLALEIIEADQIDHEYNCLSDRPDHRWVMGIELDKWNRPTRYAILTKHPGDWEIRSPYVGVKHIFVPASDVIHIYGIEERVNQLRSEPLLTPIILEAHGLHQYKRSHMVKKRSQANQLGWITTPDSLEGEIVDNQRTVESEAGVYRRLNPGESVIPPDFGAEDSVYPEFIKDSLRTQAVGTGTSYSTISGDFSAGSYASLRIAIFENRDHWRMMHTAVITQFCQRIFEEWLYAAVMSGALPSPTFDDFWFRPERYTHARWQARSWGLLDSSKDIKAYKDARELQLESHSEQISHYTGNDFRDTIDEIASENQYKQGKGLLSELDDPKMAIKAKRPAAPARPAPQEDEDGDDDSEDD
jgi:lambda family phage portal protein